MNKTKCIVVSGPSGAGKTTIIDAFVKKYHDQVAFVVYDITRKKRENEVDGVDYNFITQDEYEKKKNDDKYAIYYELLGSSRGIEKTNIKKILNKKKIPIIVANYQNLAQVKKLFDVIPIFITVANQEILKTRLSNRYRNADENELKNRIESTTVALNTQKYYKFIIVNEVLEQSVKQFEQIFQNEVMTY